jgi:hypothetical protein
MFVEPNRFPVRHALRRAGFFCFFVLGLLGMRAGYAQEESAPAEPTRLAAPLVAVEIAEGDDEAAVRQAFDDCVAAAQVGMHVNLWFVRIVCDTTPEQQQQLLAAATQALHEAAQTYAEQQVREQRLRIAGRFAGRRSDNQVNVADDVNKALARAIADTLSEEQIAAYRLEDHKRRAQKLRAAADLVVTELDEQLRLSEEQRAQIRERLLTYALAELTDLHQLMQSDRHVFSAIKAEHVLPYLDQQQALAFQYLQQGAGAVHDVDFIGRGGQGVIRRVRVDDGMLRAVRRAERVIVEERMVAPAR